MIGFNKNLNIIKKEIMVIIIKIINYLHIFTMPNQPTDHLLLGERIAYAPDTPNSYRQVTDASAFNKPCIVVFGGAQTVDCKQSNGIAKRVQIMLGRHNHYDGGTSCLFGHVSMEKANLIRRLIEAYIARKRHTPVPPDSLDIERRMHESTQEFVHKYILPMVTESFDPKDKGDLEKAFEKAKP